MGTEDRNDSSIPGRLCPPEGLLQYMREHTDDIEAVVVPIQPKVYLVDTSGNQYGITKKPAVLIRMCSGVSHVINHKEAEKLINDGVLQRLKIPCILDDLGASSGS